MNASSKRSSRSHRAVAVIAATALAAPLLIASAGTAGAHGGHGTPAQDAKKLAKTLVRESSAKDAYRHLRVFQAIADANGGNRAAGTPGHAESAEYVYKVLKKAGYRVSYDAFEFTYIETLAEKASVVSPAPRELGISAMSYTRSTPVGGLTAPLAAAAVDATPGCEAGDYAAGAFTGRIALVKRGGCTFAQKQQIAAEAGAVGAIIYNNTSGVLSGTLGDTASARIPTAGLSQAEGEALAAEVAAGEVTVAFEVRQLQETRTTDNVIAETRGGDADDTVFLGAHLDSVVKGPGINDNGSGSAGLLEVAQELAEAVGQQTGHHPGKQPRNKVKFAFWSAEELGLAGSESYVERLTEEQLRQIRLYLNFDMIASPNHAQFVYDGDDSDATGAGPGPEGSAQLERDINAYLDSQGRPHEGTDFTGRSDYGPFIAVGIPSGGTFTGAEGIKTEAQAAKYGGTAGVAYDACYHEACDDLRNISMKAFGVNIGVIANAVGTYAHDLSSLGTPVVSEPTTGGDGSGGGLHSGHDEVAE
ncbi:M28 family metallopeptidase [Streptomyces sp. S.PB5]|uniref:M28 family metallopeptidase n=1 Tax=Streptomyces sp. S.PB5 TaxID=3020844 RepID=UPI0025B1AADA|nr:M28 family metallopeptidase [Streptomyces sp. S.PB5]MDN3020391.1 M28 family metallopeptidase [Streptomyces sp. S.PB5]